MQNDIWSYLSRTNTVANIMGNHDVLHILGTNKDGFRRQGIPHDDYILLFTNSSYVDCYIPRSVSGGYRD